ncbi:hypothetical protein DUNSADRAFT_1049 [Dunaliella salina]|uniref:Secreted protein n=1 Tax=Dunaliella salina TaxID=3046 RepID=A0ABQ7FY31_DUNSA|nr:hypothetical protein DUNSADRAFT_1049 [Dunaliella salina]|eukprot:KAF5827263.1 hypothetical protein DUNSADRAFT_1049 [Dunaliella salina]
MCLCMTTLLQSCLPRLYGRGSPQQVFFASSTLHCSPPRHTLEEHFCSTSQHLVPYLPCPCLCSRAIPMTKVFASSTLHQTSLPCL